MKKEKTQTVKAPCDHDERFRKLVQAAFDVQERERAELGHALHDNINQILTATKLLLHAALHDPAIKDEMLELCVENVSKAIDETRKLCRSLVTPALNELSLMESIRDLADTFQLTNPLRINLVMSPDCDALLNKRQQIALYRIVQEQLINIIRHAGASRVQIALEQNGNGIHLEITDNGVGFDIHTKRGGIGFSNMQSRAELLNGRLEVVSEPGKGCKVTIDLPME